VSPCSCSFSARSAFVRTRPFPECRSSNPRQFIAEVSLPRPIAGRQARLLVSNRSCGNSTARPAGGPCQDQAGLASPALAPICRPKSPPIPDTPATLTGPGDRPFKFWWWSVRFGRRLEKERRGAHIPRMETIVKCDCGAEYKRTEAKFLMPHTGHVSCEVCGAVLESWLVSTHVATFELVDFLRELHAKGVDLFLHQQGLDTRRRPAAPRSRCWGYLPSSSAR
jgi:hypothetical protein